MAHPVIWSSKAFFYPIGNTPATSLTEHIPPEEDATVLTLGCGDLRNALFTIDLEDKHPLKRELDITFCDLEPAVLARNVFISTLLIDQCNEDTIQQLWKVYLDVFIDKATADLVISHCTKLLDLTSDMERWNAHPYSGSIKFCTMDTVAALRRLWNKYITPAQVMESLKPQVLEEMKNICEDKTGDMEVATAIRSAGIMAMDMVLFATSHFKHYWAQGVTDTKATALKQATHVNPTLLYSSSGDRFNLHYGTDPIMCFHLAPALAGVQGNPATPAKSIGTVVAIIQSQFASWCHSFHRRTNAGEATSAKLQLRFFVGNAMSLCKAILSVTQGGDIRTPEYTSPWGASTVTLSDDYAPSATPRAPLSFNVIDTSNLADHLGFLNILLVASPLLKRDASSILFTHSLVGSKGIDLQHRSALEEIGVDLPLLTALLGLVPDRASSEFTSQCMSQEVMLSSMVGSHQLLELNAWRVVNPGKPDLGYSIASDPTGLAKALSVTYLKLFADEGTAALGGMMQGGRMPLKHYVRDSFVYFLTLVKACYAGNWQEAMGRLMMSIETDRSLIVGLNNYQDFTRGLHLAGLWDIMPNPNSFTPSARNFIFRGWKDIPNAITVVMAIPRAKIQDLIDDTVNSQQIRTPCIQCEILCPGGQNAFSSFQPTFGKIEETGTGPSAVVAIQEDPAGWAGESDLIVHFLAPAWILVQWPADQYKISLAMFPNMASSGYYSRKLGLHLSIYSTTLADSKRAFILRDRPRATSQAISQHGNLSTSPATLTLPGITDHQLVALAFDNANVSSATIRCSITDEKAAVTLAMKTTQVNAKPLSSTVAQVSFPGFTSTLMFPYPIDGSALKTRIARKSCYVEIEARVARVAKASLKHDPFPVTRTRAGGLLQSRMHYLFLDALPALRTTVNADDSSNWLRPHLGLSLNEEKEKAEASGQPKSGLLDLKESLSSIYIRCLESNNGKPTLFKLTDPSDVGTYAILFVSTLRIDLTGSTVVADACILTLTFAAMDDPSLNRALSGLVGQKMVSVDVITPAEEIKWWKVYIPTAVERCRTWKHRKNCEYVAEGIPRSLEMGTDPICSCGRGKDLGGFANVKEWVSFKPFVTRLALGMPFPMSLLGGTASKIREMVEAKKVDGSVGATISGRGDEACLACGAFFAVLRRRHGTVSTRLAYWADTPPVMDFLNPASLLMMLTQRPGYLEDTYKDAARCILHLITRFHRPSSSYNRTQISSTMTDLFATSVKGDVITPGHPEYDSSLERWAKNAERKARAVVFVKDAEDVAKALSYAKESGLLIAIRGGGHNSAGASSAEDGLVIDLSKYLNHVRVEEENKLAYVGGGALWRDVDAETIMYGLATTGVGGLTLGGGYGFLTGRHGLTIDNLKQVTIVTADGSILTANITENVDLFWAIRGGGSNFGVVTEFVYDLHPQRKTVFAGIVIFTPNKFEELMDRTKTWYGSIKEDEAMLQTAAISPEGHPILVVTLFYSGSEEEGRASFKDILALGPVVDLAKEIPYEQLNGLQNENVKHGDCYYLRGFSHKAPDFESTMAVFAKMTEIAKGGSFASSVIFEYVPLAKVNSVPISSTAFRRQLSPNVLAALQWDGGSPEKTAEAKKIIAELEDVFVNGQDGLSDSDKLGYTNYGHDVEIPAGHIAHPSLAHVAARSQLAFGSNYPKLRNLKKKYDPDNVFNRWYPIAPAA